MSVSGNPRAVPWLAMFAFSACDPTAFSQYQTDTPVVTIPEPVTYPDLNFGAVLAVASDDGTQRDWLIGAGGLPSAVGAVPLRSGTSIGGDVEDTQLVCDEDVASQMCGGTVDFGSSLAGIAQWSGSSACVFTGAFPMMNHQIVGTCLGSTTSAMIVLTPPAGFDSSGFGLSLAAPRRRSPTENTPADILFAGAPAAPGHLFVVQPPNVVTDVTPPGITTMVGATLGDAVAVGRISTGGTTDLLLIAGDTTTRAVQVLRGDPRVGRAMQPIGCILHGAEPGFGGSLTAGDVDGDGSDDVIVAASDVMSRRPTIHVFLTSTSPSSTACDGASWPEAATLANCTDDAERSVSCAGIDSGFGIGLAAGDIDADGRDELLIGAPRATVAGIADAGAVWVVHAAGAPGGTVALTTAAVLRDSVANSTGRLGQEIIVARLGMRDEPIVAEPGVSAVRVFLCTGIPGDTPGGALDAQCR